LFKQQNAVAPKRSLDRDMGFGTNLVRRIVTGQFAGEVFYDWEPDGLVVRLTAPSDRLHGNDG
jgi:two-component sensor histidine kinase